MKRKAIVLLSSILAGALLVGGSFAAFAVTDNADPFGINVTPGDLDVDKTTYVTLNWGDSTGLAGVGNFKVGEYRKAGVVSLKATPAYTGVFTVKIEDATTGEKGVADAKLLDYLNVYLYDKDLDLAGEPAALPTGEDVVLLGQILKATEKDDQGAKSLVKNLEGTPAGRELSIFVNLDSSASPVFAQMANDKVYLSVEWAPKAGDVATDRTIYYSKPSAWDKVYAYAWADDKVNAAWPGVEMVNAYQDVYQISIPAGMETIIFNKGVGGEGNQTGNISLEGYDAATKPYWNGSAWDAKPEDTSTAEISCLVNGSPVAITDVVQPGDLENDHIYKVDLEAGDKVSFKNGLATVTFGGGANEFTAAIDGKYVFYYSKDGNVYVDFETYYVVGILNGAEKWDKFEAAYKLEPNTANEGEYMINDLTLKAGDKVKVSNGINYYPGGDATEYNITVDGTYDLYFRPKGNSEWANGFFFIG